jgi:hypothetical protein
MFATFCVINRLLGGRWFFLEPSLRFAMTFYGAANPWKPTVFYWTRAVWLPLPIVASLGAILSLFAPPVGERTFARALQATLLAAVAAWVLSDLFANSALLRNSSYTSYLVPLALIALPLQGERFSAAGRLRTVVAIELAAIAALVAVHVTFLWRRDLFAQLAAALSPAQSLDPNVIVVCLSLAAGTLAVVSLRTVTPPARRELVFALAMALSFIMPHHWRDAGMANARAEFETTALAHRFVTSQVGRHPVRFWYQLPKGTVPPFRSIACTYLWGWVLVNEEMPRLTTDEAATIKPDTRLVLLINGPAEAADARAALRQFGLDYAVIASQTFDGGGEPFSVVIADLTSLKPGA